MEKLREIVIAIQTVKPIAYSLEELYQAIENMSQLTNLTEWHVKADIEPFLAESMDKLVFLKKINEWWQAYCQQMIMMRSIFLYLDWTLQNPTILSIWDVCLDLFCIHIALNPLVQRRTVEGLLLLIEKERNGHAVDRALLKSLLRMLCDLQIYQTAFQEEFLAATMQLYKAEGQSKMQELEVPEYLQQVSKRLAGENERLLHYLDSSMKHPLIYSVEKEQLAEQYA